MTFAEAEIHEDFIEEDNTVIASALPENLPHVPLTTFKRYSNEEMVARSASFYDLMNNRRTLRFFSSESVPKEVMENIIKTGGKYIYV